MHIILAARRSGWQDDRYVFFEGPKEAGVLRALEQMVDLGDVSVEPTRLRVKESDFSHVLTTKGGVRWLVVEGE